MSAAAGRVPGHTLIEEGAAFELAGNMRYARRFPGAGSAGEGHGLCSCREASAWLESASQRKQWHRNHKLDVLRRSHEMEAEHRG